MKRKTALLISLLAALFAPQLSARKIAGVELPEQMKVGGVELILNGAGVREKLFFDIYAIGLYLKKKEHDPKQIIEADQPMAIRMHIVSNLVTPEKMASNVEESFSRSTKGQVAPIKERKDKMIAVFRNGIEKGDIYDLVYLPGKGVTISKNGEKKQLLPGLDFKKALFGIWLAAEPLSHQLKNQLLGK